MKVTEVLHRVYIHVPPVVQGPGSVFNVSALSGLHLYCWKRSCATDVHPVSETSGRKLYIY